MQKIARSPRVLSPLARPARSMRAQLRLMPQRLQCRQSALVGIPTFRIEYLAQDGGRHPRPQMGPEGAPPKARLAGPACPQCLCWAVRRQDLRLPCFLQFFHPRFPLCRNRRRARTTSKPSSICRKDGDRKTAERHSNGLLLASFLNFGEWPRQPPSVTSRLRRSALRGGLETATQTPLSTRMILHRQ